MSNYRNDLLDNQRVGKRRPRPPVPEGTGEKKPVKDTHIKPAFRPAGVVSLTEQNIKIIEKVKQNPARHHRPKIAANPLPETRPMVSMPEPKRIEEANPPERGASEKPGFLSQIFTIYPAPPAAREKQEIPEPVEVPEDNPAPLPDDEYVYAPQPKAKRINPVVFAAIPFVTVFVLVLGLLFVIYSPASAANGIGDISSRDQGSDYIMARYAGVSTPEIGWLDGAGGNAGEIIPLDMTETFSWKTYKVQKGDTVSGLAQAFSISMDAIIASNGITNARALREGEVLRIPNMDGIPYTVKAGDSLSAISQSTGVPLEAILDANDLQTDIINAGMSLFIPGARMNRDDLRMALGELFIYPVRGARLSSPFGWRNDPFTGVRSHHGGIDLAVAQGTPIVAAMDGTVSAQAFDRIYGNYVILTHSGGLQTMYAHMYTTAVKKGDRVLQGARVGTVGSTGYSTGAHLHFGVFKNGIAVNPLDLLNPPR